MGVLAAGCGSKGNNGNSDLSVAPDLAGTVDLAAGVVTCDPVKQTCIDPTVKCTLSNMGTMTMPDNQRACVPIKGTNKDGDPCTRTQFGDDDCDKGLVCTLRGASLTMLRCRKFCHVAADCDAGAACTGQLAAGNTKDGLCVPLCTPFGSECATPFSCGGIFQDLASTMTMPKLVLTCRGTGAAPINGDCMTSDDCAAGGICDPTLLVCIPFCDDDHPCPATLDDGGLTDDGGVSLSCAGITGAPNNGGVCQ